MAVAVFGWFSLLIMVFHVLVIHEFMVHSLVFW